ncbi:hypothetical protein [Maribacter halichondriae]|uniref:hypothetical protein n=1 Tax=Maribacter halichondriae TaxID=2980554 RepID=UPI00235A1FEC|nr:hypothetical protein [Maribacter sp. Hal144]
MSWVINWTEVSNVFVGRGRKGQAALRHLFFRAAPRGSEKPERKDFPDGPVKRVRMGRIEVEEFADFRRGLNLGYWSLCQAMNSLHRWPAFSSRATRKI